LKLANSVDAASASSLEIARTVTEVGERGGRRRVRRRAAAENWKCRIGWNEPSLLQFMHATRMHCARSNSGLSIVIYACSPAFNIKYIAWQFLNYTNKSNVLEVISTV
jgi:hypothetical protein